MTTHSAPASEQVRPPREASTRRLLLFAAVAGPVFYASSIIQGITRDGFDIRIHPLSQLATGSVGWVQMLTFAIAGLGGIALAIAYRRVRTEGIGRRLVPIFVGIFGAAFLLAGLFPMDPQNGFPVGAPEGVVALSWHSIVHTSAAALSFLALAGAAITLLIREIRARHGAAAVGHGVVAVVLLLPMSPTESSIQIAITGAVAFGWVSVMALRVRRSA
ncbi:DUF998 domain-containing protein [Microbacterium aurugineum]|uniref:DUF998 domain-containing protein n=1 Tax=Microbacterium aurugineum TaxID=2851642 RepID=UPI0020BEAD55|nr:DUF998 domain-containing protein [Microbacterium aurugineum]MCK8478502.1 DUF998 domain-containing protein [Microbacterium aurugineum]